MVLRIHPKNVTFTPRGPTELSKSSFYQRMTARERSDLRGTTDPVLDLVDQLSLLTSINNDRKLNQLLLDSGIFNQTRINELFE